jgi:hypothetical protein
MEPTELVGASIWIVMIVLGGFAVYRVRTRRSHIGSAGAGAVYGMMHDEKRKAVEIVVNDKAAAHDFEHADDKNRPSGRQAVRPSGPQAVRPSRKTP